MNTVDLYGCKSEPLLNYLAGLGVVRLIAEQADPDVSARWEGDHLAIISRLREEKIIDFFADSYKPTPLIAPWNRGGGFRDGEERPSEKIIKKVESIDSDRFEPYRKAIQVARKTWERAKKHGLIEKGVVPKKHKGQFIELCRGTFPDEALEWLDTSVVLLDTEKYDIAFPLILGGTGGNLGRMDISYRFLQSLEHLGMLDAKFGDSRLLKSKSQMLRPLLTNALFGYDDGQLQLLSKSSGQFDPGGVGGPNSSSIGDASSLVNPWSFVLAMEGSVTFASAAARRFSSAGLFSDGKKASMPFTVEVTAAGHASMASAEKSKGELWAPLWRDKLSYREIRYLMSEGRSQWGRSDAVSGLDFVRAVATLGVDRSINEFVRYLISVRNGQSVIAVPIGRFKVSGRVRREVDLLRQLDDWIGKAESNTASREVRTAFNAVTRAQFEVARSHSSDPHRLLAVLTALADLERSVARSTGYREKQKLQPIDSLSADEWLPKLDDHSVEFRVAAGLASLRDRLPFGGLNTAQAIGGSLATLLRPAKRARARGRSTLGWSDKGPRVPGLGHRPLFDVLNDVFSVRAALASSMRADGRGHRTNSGIDSGYTTAGLPFAFDNGGEVSIEDVGRLLSGQLDEKRISNILAGLLLLKWDRSRQHAVNPVNSSVIDSGNPVSQAMPSPVAASTADSGMINPDDGVALAYVVGSPIYVMLAPFFRGFMPVAPTLLAPNPTECTPVRPRPEWVGSVRSGVPHNAARSAAHLLRGHGWNLIADPDDFKSVSDQPGILAAALLLRPGKSQMRYLLNRKSTNKTRWTATDR